MAGAALAGLRPYGLVTRQDQGTARAATRSFHKENTTSNAIRQPPRKLSNRVAYLLRHTSYRAAGKKPPSNLLCSPIFLPLQGAAPLFLQPKKRSQDHQFIRRVVASKKNNRLGVSVGVFGDLMVDFLDATPCVVVHKLMRGNLLLQNGLKILPFR